MRSTLDYVQIDERSIEDLLNFARQYSQELQYFDITNQPVSDWSAFLGAPDDDLRLSDLAAFLLDPAKFTPDSHPSFFVRTWSCISPFSNSFKLRRHS